MNYEPAAFHAILDDASDAVWGLIYAAIGPGQIDRPSLSGNYTSAGELVRRLFELALDCRAQILEAEVKDDDFTKTLPLHVSGWAVPMLVDNELFSEGRPEIASDAVERLMKAEGFEFVDGLSAETLRASLRNGAETERVELTELVVTSVADHWYFTGKSVRVNDADVDIWRRVTLGNKSLHRVVADEFGL